MAQPLGDELPAGVGNWSRQIYDDEVLFWPERTSWLANGPFISEIPFVAGFFVVDVPDDYEETTRILAGPFPTLEAAIASIALLA